MPLVELDVDREDPDCQRLGHAEQLELEMLEVLLQELRDYRLLVVLIVVVVVKFDRSVAGVVIGNASCA